MNLYRRGTKKFAALIVKAEWQNALHDGRVVRINEISCTSYPTVEQAIAAEKIARAAGLIVERLRLRQNPADWGKA